MKLIRVEAGGFRSYRELALDFGGCQLIRICGKNGVGKSTIIESLGWTIFGRAGSSIRDATHRGFSSAETPDASSHQPLPWVLWTVEVENELIQISRWNGGSQVERVKNRQVIKTGSRREPISIIERLEQEA